MKFQINITRARQIRVRASAKEQRYAPIESLASTLTPIHRGLVYEMWPAAFSLQSIRTTDNIKGLMFMLLQSHSRVQYQSVEA